jgi:prophage regulatory protein
MSGRVLLRKRDVLAKTGLSESELYRQMGLNKDPFPPSVSIGKRAVAWVESEVESWIAARIAARDAEQAEAA